MWESSVCEALLAVFAEIELGGFVSYFPCARLDYGFGGGAFWARRSFFVKILEHCGQGLFGHDAELI